MDFFLSMLGVFAGIILAIVVIIFIVYLKLKATVGSQNMKELKNAISNVSNLQKEEYTREKNVKGMTKLLEARNNKRFSGIQ